jgi:hypothetical protein
MRWAEERDGSCPTQGVLLTLAEILNVSRDPREARSDGYICGSCRREFAVLYGLCGACWLREYVAAHPGAAA